MHRVLSYQTAVRANSSRDIREYVTKRTCVSLVLTLAFFTLISGFLLGKFVADRQHQLLVQNIKSAELKQMKLYKSNRIELLTSAENLNQIIERKQTNTSLESLNSQIYNSYTSCVLEPPPSTSMSVNGFVEILIDKHSSKLFDCLTILRSYIEQKISNN